jgi:hypothetical protein
MFFPEIIHCGQEIELPAEQILFNTNDVVSEVVALVAGVAVADAAIVCHEEAVNEVDCEVGVRDLCDRSLRCLLTKMNLIVSNLPY